MRRRGARILDRNLVIGRGEIDILAEVGGRRIVVEVKTVTPSAGRPGAAAVDDAKAARLRRLAASLDPPVRRIDIIEILLDRNGAAVRWLRWT